MSRRFFSDPDIRQKIWDRFYEEIHRTYKRDVSFYEAYDVPKGTFGHWKDRTSDPPVDVIAEFCHDQRISLDYIYLGLLPKANPQKKKE